MRPPADSRAATEETHPMAKCIAERLRDGRPVFGTMLRMIRSPGVVAIARNAGLDFIMLDLEHAPYSFETLADLARAGRALGLAVLARVPEVSRGVVSRALDCGVAGVMGPMIESPEQARAFVSWAKYPPLGRRGWGSSGGHTDYARPSSASAFMEESDRRTLAIAQIETAAAVACIEEIAAVEGLDVLLVGPNDLAVSLGCADDPMSAAEHEAIGRVARAARAHGKIFGMHAGANLLGRWTCEGVRLIISSLDVGVLEEGFRNLSDATRGLFKG